jgi:tetratricopeptide (TPR) repeat protein
MSIDLNIEYDMSYSINNETLRAYPNNKDSMLLGILFLKSKLEISFIDKDKAELLSNISYYEKLIGDYINSEKNQLESIKIFEKINYNLGRFISLIRLAQLYQFMCNYKKSTDLFEYLELELNNNNDFEHYKDFLYQHIGKNEFEKENYSLALKYFHKALKIRKNKNDLELIYSTNISINRIESLLKNKIYE